MRLRLLALLLWLFAASAPAQTSVAPDGGDGWMDAQLADMNRYARRYPDAFADELVRYYNAPRDLVTALLAQGWTPAEVYYACALASVGGQPCRAVAQDHGAHRDGGWSATADRLGIATGAVTQQRLRAQLLASYRRWGRPTLPEPPAPHDAPDPHKAPAPAADDAPERPASRD